MAALPLLHGAIQASEPALRFPPTCPRPAAVSRIYRLRVGVRESMAPRCEPPFGATGGKLRRLDSQLPLWPVVLGIRGPSPTRPPPPPPQNPPPRPPPPTYPKTNPPPPQPAAARPFPRPPSAESLRISHCRPQPLAPMAASAGIPGRPHGALRRGKMAELQLGSRIFEASASAFCLLPPPTRHKEVSR